MLALKNILKPLYKDQTDRVVQNLQEYIKKLPKIENTHPNKYWYKFIDLYLIYPDGVIYDPTKSPLQNLIPHLEHISRLGCNAVHILPFLDSPMIDKGFDISNFYKIRPALGTLEDLKEFKKTADKKNIRVFMDLVFNHISDAHEWFQKAVNGDKYYRDFFIWRQKKPSFIQIIEKDNAMWAQYLTGGKNKLVRIEFPQHAGPIPHWEQQKDGNWYYHTYYPQQLDLNWFNPNVFIEVSKILLYWTGLGFNFRLDATPFIAKSAYKQVDGGNEYTHLVLSGLKYLSGQINPESAFLIESYESAATVMSYFGSSNRVIADLGYNFHLCAHTWIAIVLQNPLIIWNILNKLSSIPKHAEWINFLRNHDELGLGYLDADIAVAVKKELMPLGLPFGQGIAGRTFSLLGENKKRYLCAYFLLASLPGGMLIPYGDEIAKKNISLRKLNSLEKKDTRNINRGTFTGTDFKKENQDITASIEQIIAKRKLLREYLNVFPLEQKLHENILSGVYKVGSSELNFFINLSPKILTIPFNTKNHHKIIHINNVKINSSKITLSPFAGLWLQK